MCKIFHSEFGIYAFAEITTRIYVLCVYSVQDNLRRGGRKSLDPGNALCGVPNTFILYNNRLPPLPQWRWVFCNIQPLDNALYIICIYDYLLFLYVYRQISGHYTVPERIGCTSLIWRIKCTKSVAKICEWREIRTEKFWSTNTGEKKMYPIFFSPFRRAIRVRRTPTHH